VFKIDEDATFERCVLLDGRELDGDWWIVRPLGVLGSSGVLMAQDRASGNLAPLTSVMMLVAKVGDKRPATAAPAEARAEIRREEAPAAGPSWTPERLQTDPAQRPAPAFGSTTMARPAKPAGSDWSDILLEDDARGLESPIGAE
jgi:hypothetical protein